MWIVFSSLCNYEKCLHKMSTDYTFCVNNLGYCKRKWSKCRETSAFININKNRQQSDNKKCPCATLKNNAKLLPTVVYQFTLSSGACESTCVHPWLFLPLCLKYQVKGRAHSWMLSDVWWMNEWGPRFVYCWDSPEHRSSTSSNERQVGTELALHKGLLRKAR